MTYICDNDTIEMLLKRIAAILGIEEDWALLKTAWVPDKIPFFLSQDAVWPEFIKLFENSNSIPRLGIQNVSTLSAQGNENKLFEGNLVSRY